MLFDKSMNKAGNAKHEEERADVLKLKTEGKKIRIGFSAIDVQECGKGKQ